jgi:hypothetical protein
MLNDTIIKNSIDKYSTDFEWIEAKNLQLNDMLVYSIPKNNIEVKSLLMIPPLKFS